jgi:hypothetical protein
MFMLLCKICCGNNWHQSAEGAYKICCFLIICVKNKLFGSVKEPHELMHQPNNTYVPE